MMQLHNPFGVAQGGSNSFRFDTYHAAADYLVEQFARATDEFTAG
jgi:hypothetical protein